MYVRNSENVEVSSTICNNNFLNRQDSPKDQIVLLYMGEIKGTMRCLQQLIIFGPQKIM